MLKIANKRVGKRTTTKLVSSHRPTKAETTAIANMSVDALLDLHDQLQSQLYSRLSETRASLKAQLSRLSSYGVSMGSAGRKASSQRGLTRGPRKGSKVAAKYRDPKTGLTWAGRGLKPHWLVNAVSRGKTLEAFLVKRSDGNARKIKTERSRDKSRKARS